MTIIYPLFHVSVFTVNRLDCSICNEAVKLKSQSGVIASSVTENSGCGTPDCPWIVQVEPGQKINFTLMDFGLDSPERENGIENDELVGCQVYATIKEEVKKLY